MPSSQPAKAKAFGEIGAAGDDARSRRRNREVTVGARDEAPPWSLLRDTAPAPLDRRRERAQARPMGDWIDIDGEPEPTASPGVRVDADGVELVAGGARTRARWDEVLGVVRVEERVFVLVARRPPSPPWIELAPGELGRSAIELEREMRRRSEAAGYRAAPG
ncbi:MAG: hypothetical protein M3Y87_02410, partial [Myxococcota bacterium]|nr:hypothetical protein [Myxococcota bacterium]